MEILKRKTQNTTLIYSATAMKKVQSGMGNSHSLDGHLQRSVYKGLVLPSFYVESSESREEASTGKTKQNNKKPKPPSQDEAVGGPSSLCMRLPLDWLSWLL